jgi:hypothetical protein
VVYSVSYGNMSWLKLSVFVSIGRNLLHPAVSPLSSPVLYTTSEAPPPSQLAAVLFDACSNLLLSYWISVRPFTLRTAGRAVQPSLTWSTACNDSSRNDNTFAQPDDPRDHLVLGFTMQPPRLTQFRQ